MTSPTVTAVVHQDGSVNTIVVKARTGWTDQQWDSAIGQHVLLSATPLSWDMWRDGDGNDVWVIAYKPQDILSRQH